MFLFKKKNSAVNVTACEARDNEREEDGFVLVGETSDEKSTVKPNNPVNHEPPPKYEKLNEVSTSSGSYKAEQRTPQPEQCNQTNPTPNVISTHQPTHHSGKHDSSFAIQDIPFRFAGSVQVAANLRLQTWDISDVMPNVWSDLSEYSYDFTMEYNVLE
uniref:Uncharacterized LOC100182510 n=1 Tax=Ciona intestinalis TaxID=7719 RepID=F6U805_CIOIN|nr:uncharacterized protein LOC100182510 [Ciona intestinalis]|eukprot:XP_002131450.1 uncharacterized protein LOC100182510 [Ciona intestinalis]